MNDIDYGYGGEVIAINGKSVSTGPGFSSTNERELTMRRIAKKLQDKGFIIHTDAAAGQKTRFEIWEMKNENRDLGTGSSISRAKYKMSIYTPKKDPTPAAKYEMTGRVAAALECKMYIGMVELWSGTYLKLVKKR